VPKNVRELTPEIFAAAMQRHLSARHGLGDRLRVEGQLTPDGGACFEVWLDGKALEPGHPLHDAIDDFFKHPQLEEPN
jgi:hypothetical protein